MAKLSAEQKKIVNLVRSRARRKKSSPREEKAALLATRTESNNQNLKHGDKDSLGVLQERTSIYGREHALNPTKSIDRFLDDAKKANNGKGSAGQLAQRVQRSAYPDAYDKHSKEADALMSRKKVAASKVAKKPAAPATAPTSSTGLYSAPLAQLDEEGARVNDIERRRLADNNAYQRWVAGQQGKVQAASNAADADSARRQAAVALINGGQQSALNSQLDAMRAGRAGSTSNTAGYSREGLVNDQQANDALLAAGQQTSAANAQSNQQKAGFLAAATLASGAASAAKIRGESSQERDALRQGRTEILMRREDQIVALRQAGLKAEADMAQTQLDADLKRDQLKQQGAIAGANIASREGISAATIAARSKEAAKDRASRQKIAAQRAGDKNGDGKVSPSEKRQRAAAASKLRSDAAKATALAKQFGSNPKLTTAQIRAGVLSQLPNLSNADVVLNAAVSAARDKRGKGKPYGKAASDLNKALKALGAGR